jgi:chloride channel protein, CIC family
MILAVAFSLGVRRLLSAENIYTMKLTRRGHLVPKALHANMFLVRRAPEVMERDILVLPAETAFDDFLSRPEHGGRMRHVIVVRENRILGVVRVNTGLRRGLEGIHTGITLGDVARRIFTIVRENDVAFEVIQRVWRKRAVMALVIRGRGVPRPGEVVGVITKEHVADSVATIVQIYPS